MEFEKFFDEIDVEGRGKLSKADLQDFVFGNNDDDPAVPLESPVSGVGQCQHCAMKRQHTTRALKDTDELT